MAMKKIFNLRADPDWIGIVRGQARQAGCDNPGQYVRDLINLIEHDPEIRDPVHDRIFFDQEVHYAQTQK